MATVATERKVFVGGEWVETGDWVEVRSPYSGDVVGRVAKAGAAETRRAIDASEQAMAEPLPAHKRAEILVKVAGYLGRRHDEVARVISDEAGKPMKAARVEAKRAMSTYTMAAVEARKLAGEMVPMDASQAGEGKLGFTIRVPIGVVGAISPFNFPLNLVAHKLAPALAAGCAVVLKPASQTPLSALLLAELEEEAGLPPGWLSVLVGPAAEIGDVLVEDERVRAITFTGSGDVGWKLRERAPSKRVNLELGNATPVVVAADADLDEGARDRILGWIDEARAAGARVLTGGERDGELIRPTVIAEAAHDLKVSCEEVFGPVCTVNAVDSLDEAVELANGTRYGLQAGVFTSGLRAALDV